MFSTSIGIFAFLGLRCKIGNPKSQDPGTPLSVPSGYSTASSADPGVQAAATFFVTQQKLSSNFTILSASTQVVAGCNFMLQIRTGGVTYQATIYQDLRMKYSITKSQVVSP